MLSHLCKSRQKRLRDVSMDTKTNKRERERERERTRSTPTKQEESEHNKADACSDCVVRVGLLR